MMAIVFDIKLGDDEDMTLLRADVMAKIEANKLYSDTAIRAMLLEAMQERGLKVTVVRSNGQESEPYHCCRRCGWSPVEGMKSYMEIHGGGATCIRCGDLLILQLED